MSLEYFHGSLLATSITDIHSANRKEEKYIAGHRAKIKLNGAKSFYAVIFCSTLFFCSFLFPVMQMIYWTIKFPKYFQDINFWNIGFNTLLLVFLSCILMVIFAFIANYGNRVTKS